MNKRERGWGGRAGEATQSVRRNYKSLKATILTVVEVHICDGQMRNLGTTGQTMGRGIVVKGTGSGMINTRDGNKASFDGMVDGGEIPQKYGNGREIEIGNEILHGGLPVLVPSSPLPVQSRPYFPVLTFTARAPGIKGRLPAWA